MTTHPEDAMTRERALEDVRKHLNALRAAASAQSILPTSAIFRLTDPAMDVISRALASAQQEPAPAADVEVARWMMEHSYATGHGDTVADMLGELEAQVQERALRRYAGDGGVTDEQVEASARAIAANSGKDPDQIIVNEGGRATWTFYSHIVRLALEAAARAKSSEKGGAR